MPASDILQLDQLKIASPCSANWEAMAGDERVRLCSQCQLQVYDLSALTTDAAVQLVSQAEGRLCVRFYRRHDGTVLTQDCPVGRTRVLRRLKWLAAGVASVLALASGGLLLAGARTIDQQPVTTTATAPHSSNGTQVVVASLRSLMTSCWEYFFPPPAPTMLMGEVCLPPPPVLTPAPPSAPANSPSS